MENAKFQCGKCGKEYALQEAVVCCDNCFPKWHPIEKAPRDGKRFLFTNGHIVGIGFYVAGKHFAADSWQGTNTQTIPTHWMPLPEKPKDGE